MTVSDITAGRPTLARSTFRLEGSFTRAFHMIRGESYKAYRLITPWYRDCARHTEERGEERKQTEKTLHEIPCVRKTKRERERETEGYVYMYTSRKFTALFNRIRLRYCDRFRGGGWAPNALSRIIRYVRAICRPARDAHSPAAADTAGCVNQRDEPSGFERICCATND